MHKAKPIPIAVKRSSKFSFKYFMLTPISGYVPIERAFIVSTKEKKSIGTNPMFKNLKPLRINPNAL